ncbi:MAG TPA: polymer-forming cytoskeletal protein [Cytophagaceae bacterium]|jgi:cytoskeletal protein CcmA (bactofilin family)|nr:polymer-forming cytoskeletal protein [Cytophagaceae bacterium]
MFKSDASKKELEQLGNASTIIAKNAVIEGNMETVGNLRIEGKLVGHIRCKAKVAMGDSSLIEGNIVTQNAEIAGCIKGQIEVTDLLILKPTAVIEGDIIAGKIMIEVGAIFNGTCKMGVAIKEINIGEGKIYREAKTA